MKYIPKEIQTQELCDAAIKAICWGYKYCLEEFKTYENSFSAVKRNGEIIEFVTKKLINYKLCEAAANSRYPCLNHIPNEFLTQEICEMAVRANGENVKWVPDEFMSSDMAWLAINSPAPSNPSTDMCASNIQYIKGQFLTKEIIVDSAKRWYCTYNRVPKECRTKEVEEAVLEVEPYCIKDMEQTPERCMKAMKKYPLVLSNCIALENITPELIEYFESLDGLTQDRIKIMCSNEKVQHINSLSKNKQEMTTTEKILENCRISYWRYLNIPKELITDELNKEILKVCPYCIRYIEQTPENCMIAIWEQPLVAEELIKRENLTREMAEYILGLSDKIRDEFMDEDWDYFESLLQD